MTKKRLPLALALTSIVVGAAVVLIAIFVPINLSGTKTANPKPTTTEEPAPAFSPQLAPGAPAPGLAGIGLA